MPASSDLWSVVCKLTEFQCQYKADQRLVLASVEYKQVNKWNNFPKQLQLKLFPDAFPRNGIWQVLFLTSPKSLNDNFLLIWIREQISSSSAGEEKTAFGKKLAVIFRQRAILSFLAWTRTGETLLKKKKETRKMKPLCKKARLGCESEEEKFLTF